MLNRVVLIGRLTKDPELRYTPSGAAVARFNLAVNRKFTNQQGDREADFINVVTWRGLAENCANYVKKGSLIGLEGRIQTGKYDNAEGRTIYTTEVVADDVRFLDSRGQSNGNGNASVKNNESEPSDPFVHQGSSVDISDDDLPF